MPRPQILSLPERLDADPELTGRGVVLGFIDTGFYAHPDLMRPARRVRAFVDVTRDKALHDDFLEPHAWAWHGTMTACCAAGNGYTSGGHYRSLACEAEVVLIKVGTDDGDFTGRNVASALRLPIRHPELGIRVLSISLGVDDDDPARSDVLRAVAEVTAHGVLVIAAAGNAPGKAPEAPAAAPEALTVGGQDDANTRAAGDDTLWPSSAGTTRPGVHKPDLIAPAIGVPAPMLPGTRTAREAAALFALLAVLEESTIETDFTPSPRARGAADVVSAADVLTVIEQRIARERFLSPEYQHVQGTSFAAPITASVVAQMLQLAPDLTPARIREALARTASPLPGILRAQQGAGVLRPREATAYVRERHAKPRP